MRAASLLCVLILAKLCMAVGQSVPVSAWVPVAYLWQDFLIAALFAGFDALLRRAWAGWTVYSLIAVYAAVNVPVARVLGTPLTAPMLRATRGTLADSVAHHVTPTNVGLLLLVLAGAVAFPLLFRRTRGRQLVWSTVAAAPVILLGPLATARVDTGGLHRNALVAVVATQFPHIEADEPGEPNPSPAVPSGPDTALAPLRGAAAGRNVVLVLLESAAAQYLRPYGAAEDPMPNVTALAAQGVLFERAYAVYPESIRGLFAILCSRYPAMDTRPEMYERVTTPSLATVLGGQGYHTALFHSGRFRYLGMEAVVRERGFQVLEDAGQIGGDRDSSFGIDEPSAVRRMLGWIDGLPRGEPFFATYVPIAGHHPYETPEPGPFPERHDIDRYRNALHYADAAVGRLVDGLRARGLEQKTVVVLVGDHGQAFGQHQGNFGHTLRIFEENVRVPLIISAPAAIAGPIRVPGLASHLDITPTVLDLLGVPRDARHQGLSLLRGGRSRAYFFADASLGLLGLRDGRWKYIHETDSGRSRLFDLDADPTESTNLADTHPQIVDEYRNEVVGWRPARSHPRGPLILREYLNGARHESIELCTKNMAEVVSRSYSPCSSPSHLKWGRPWPAGMRVPGGPFLFPDCVAISQPAGRNPPHPPPGSRKTVAVEQPFGATPVTRLVALAALTALLPGLARADDLADLLNRVPGDMNTVAVINVRAINQSPRAVQEKWRENTETEYLAGAIAVPPWVPLVVVGADLQPGALARGRSIALIPVDTSVNSSVVAKRENGVIQTVDDLTLVLSPKRGYFGWPAGGIVAISSTVARQDFARWVRAGKKADKPAVSEYLQKAVADHKSAHILIAADLKDLVDPTAARAALQQSGAVPKESEVDSLVTVLSGARGIVFTAQVGSPSKAELRIEFGVPMDAFLPAFRRLWPVALERAGLEVDELKAAEPKADGKSVVLSASLSDTSLRRVLSLVATPGDAVPEDGSGRIRTPEAAAELAASLRYYRAVNAVLDDLKTQGGARGKDYVKSAAFFDAYAGRLEKLPLTNVDPVLVQYGASVGAKLRAMAGSLRGAKAQIEVYDSYKSTVWASGGLGWWGGGTSLSTNVPEMSTKQADLAAKLEPERAKIWGVLEGDRSAIRRDMLEEKYKVDFDQYKR